MVGTADLYQKYWQGFLDYCALTTTTLLLDAPPSRYYYLLPLSYRGFAISLLAAQKRGLLRCELYLDKAQAKANFARLHKHQAVIEAQLGQQGKLQWEVVPGRRGQHIVLYGPASDLYDQSLRIPNYQWLKQQAEIFSQTFTPYARDLTH